MNKSLIIILAVCLISVHAFVKRETENNDDGLESIKKQITDTINNMKKDLESVFNPETLKKNFNDAITNVNNALDSMSAKPKE